MPRYDEAVIQQHAQTLYDRADSLVVGAVVLGAIQGGLIGAATYVLARALGLSISPSWPIGGGAVLVAVSAGMRAEREAFRLRLEAQTALCQVMIQRNTAELGRRLDLLGARITERVGARQA